MQAMSHRGRLGQQARRVLTLALVVLSLAGGAYVPEWMDYNDADAGITLTP
jgi:hypothetical protein